MIEWKSIYAIRAYPIHILVVGEIFKNILGYINWHIEYDTCSHTDYKITYTMSLGMHF